MGDDATEESTPGDSPEDGSLAWGWLASVAVVAATVFVLVVAVLRTPGVPDCQGYSVAGWFLSCPWVRAFIAESVVILGVLVVVATVAGLSVGFVRLVVRRVSG